MTGVSTLGMTRADWLEARRTGIGGSDAAKIVLSPEQYKYADPGALYLDKIGEGPAEDEPSLAARHGTWCEEFVAQLWEEATGLKVRRLNFMIRSPEHPFMLADIDRKVVGRREGLECKTVGFMASRKKIKDDETGESHWIDKFIPGDMEGTMTNKPEWYCQCQHYMAVTGWDMWHLAALIDNNKFLFWDIPRDQAWIDEMVRQEAEFWNHVVRRENIWEVS